MNIYLFWRKKTAHKWFEVDPVAHGKLRNMIIIFEIWRKSLHISREFHYNKFRKLVSYVLSLICHVLIIKPLLLELGIDLFVIIDFISYIYSKNVIVIKGIRQEIITNRWLDIIDFAFSTSKLFNKFTETFRLKTMCTLTV